MGFPSRSYANLSGSLMFLLGLVYSFNSKLPLFDCCIGASAAGLNCSACRFHVCPLTFTWYEIGPVCLVTMPGLHFLYPQ